MSKITYDKIPDFGNPNKPERRKRIETMMAWIGMTDVKDLEPRDRQGFLDIIDGKAKENKAGRKEKRKKASEEFLRGLVKKPTNHERVLLENDIIPYRSADTGRSLIGKGTFSTVYSVTYKGKPAVAKVTYDPSEAALFDSGIFGELSPEARRHVPAVYDVINDEKHRLFISVVEPLVPIPVEIKHALWGGGDIGKDIEFQYDVLLKAMFEANEDIFRMYGSALNQQRVSDLTRDIFKDLERHGESGIILLPEIVGKHARGYYGNAIEDDGKSLQKVIDDLKSMVSNSFTSATFFTREFEAFPSGHWEAEAKWEHMPETKGFMRALKELRELGYHWGDMHAGNFMMRPGTGEIVVSDFGLFSENEKKASQEGYFKQNEDYHGNFLDRVRERLKRRKEEMPEKKDSEFSNNKDARMHKLENLFKTSILNIFKALRRGSSGPRVRKIQQALLGKGFTLPQYGVDGVFGTETEAAVKEFQTHNDLEVDGVVGTNTISKLEPEMAMEVAEPQTQVQEEPELLPYSLKRFKPFSRKAKILFRRAAKTAGLPEEWGVSDSLHYILQKESDGWVGRPNYTYGVRSADPKYWGQVHEEIRQGIAATTSGATGLGQLLPRNVDKYYPSGRKGIGDALEEAVGMLRYIQERYGSPDEAWAVYGGKAVKTDPETGARFTEGY